MPVTVTESEYREGIALTPSHLLVDHARWENLPAGHIVRDLINRFITPKCYLVVPGDIVDGPPCNLVIGEDVDGLHTPGFRSCDEILTTLAIACGYRWHITLDGRIHFGPA